MQRLGHVGHCDCLCSVFCDCLSSGEVVICDTLLQEGGSNSAATVLHKWQGSHQNGFAANTEDHLGDLGDQWDVEHRNRRVIP